MPADRTRAGTRGTCAQQMPRPRHDPAGSGSSRPGTVRDDLPSVLNGMTPEGLSPPCEALSGLIVLSITTLEVLDTLKLKIT